jgi:hypothetical protein
MHSTVFGFRGNGKLVKGDLRFDDNINVEVIRTSPSTQLFTLMLKKKGDMDAPSAPFQLHKKTVALSGKETPFALETSLPARKKKKKNPQRILLWTTDAKEGEHLCVQVNPFHADREKKTASPFPLGLGTPRKRIKGRCVGDYTIPLTSRTHTETLPPKHMIRISLSKITIRSTSSSLAAAGSPLSTSARRRRRPSAIDVWRSDRS